MGKQFVNQFAKRRMRRRARLIAPPAMLRRVVDRLTTVSIVGIDVGSGWVKVVEVAQARDRVVVRRCAMAARESQEPAVVLKRLMSDAGLSTPHAALGLASPEVIVRPVQFPPMPPRELASAVRLEAEQAILNGHALSEVAIDWHVLSASKRSIRGLLAVVPKSVLMARLHIAKTAGLRPFVVDVEGLALWNAYWTLMASRMPTSQTVLIINIGVHTTNVVIARSPDELLLVRDVQLGAEVVATGRGDDWLTEVCDSLSYARAKVGLRAIDVVAVTGGGSSSQLVSLLRSVLSAPVEVWNPLDQVVWEVPGLVPQRSVGPLLSVAIGLALRQPG